MAISFDETNDYYSISDDASLTLNLNWVVGVWTKVDDNSGNFFQYIASNGNFGLSNTFNLFLGESGAADSNKWICVYNQGGGVQTLTSTAATGGDGLWRLILVERTDSDDTSRLYIPAFGTTPSAVASNTDDWGTTGNINGGAWNIGRRTDGNTDRYYGSTACEFFIYHGTITSDERAALANGVSILSLGKTPAIYLPMYTAASTLYDIVGSNDASVGDSPTTVEHAPVTLGAGAGLSQRPQVAAGTNPKGPLGLPMDGPLRRVVYP